MAEILIIDDEKDMLSACAKILQALGHKPVTLASGAQAITLLGTHEFDLILCDLFMPEVDGMTVVEKARELTPNTPVIIFTAYGTIDRAVVAIKAGAFDFLEKPFEIEDLKVVIEKGLRQRKFFCEKHDLIQQLEEKFNFDNIIGRSFKMQEVFDLIKTVAPTDANVIITGESGTGKELVARSIHARSKRKVKAFIPVNCGAFPENLFESELFGYEKGAFTGALRRKPGLLEFANHGTFFLDEVCELTETLQVKLLRVLQDHKVMRLGGEEFIELDVRFVAATNRDVDIAVSDGILREDFYYRLNVVRIHIPPLRERRDDILPLAERFLRLYLKSSPKEIAGFNDDVLGCFQRYHWPGNVRELENTVERTVTLAKGDTITLAELPSQIRVDDSSPASFANQSLVTAKQQAIDEIELKYLLELLQKHSGNVTKIAADAGMTRRNLHRLLKRHGLEADSWRKNNNK
ncbi:MAG: sigma-54-dependent transcriptional regulator [bacterium]